MAESKKAENAKKKTKKVSLRERNTKAAENKQKPKRIRKAATAATKPVSSIKNVLTTEYHVLPQKKKAGFFTKSRSLTPRYISNSYQELKKVTWPGRKETWKLVFAVFMFAITLGLFIALLDYALEKLFKEIIL